MKTVWVDSHRMPPGSRRWSMASSAPGAVWASPASSWSSGRLLEQVFVGAVVLWDARANCKQSFQDLLQHQCESTDLVHIIILLEQSNRDIVLIEECDLQ